MTYNPDVHHRRSIRLQDYDYAQSGAYFVTICAFQRECLFGEIMNGEMNLNEMGDIAVTTWKWLATHYPYVELDEWVVMPNHLHGIIVRDDRGGLQTENPKPLGGLIGAFKTVSTKGINQLRNNPGCPVWQRNYYERVIRNERELATVRQYIVNNPMKWALDKDNPVNMVTLVQ